jgi:predicted kinase
VILRSDEIRKQLSGVEALTRLGADGYTAEMTGRVYDTLLDRARRVLETGHAAIADAVFTDPAHRDRMRAVASANHRPFLGVWLEADASALRQRVESRGPDASDADTGVVEQQLALSPGPIDWHRIDARQPQSSVLRLVRDCVDQEVANPADETSGPPSGERSGPSAA